ncbi:WXG100 family type VII secretion target [Nocardia terpenica]|uniref:WXG100 family type VII secretion target n=1 Tax=Nocardia terpenica TaxID=455432 RepID=UPI00142E4FEF|nr:WXG100 family type VII secretion target [Nocardia terpenica]
MRERLKHLEDTVGKRLLAEGWDGTAAVGCDGSWSEWKQGADAIADALEESALEPADAAYSYEAQEHANRDAITRAGLDVPGSGRSA